MKALSLALATTLTLTPLAVAAQEPPVRWQRRSGPTAEPVTVFHSTQAANLPTAETLRRGELLFEISHRFQPAMSQGSHALWGLDGPVTNRLGLAYAPTDRIMVGVLRSNLDDNLEFNAKARVLEGGRGSSVPWMAGVMGGVAINTQTIGGPGYNGDETQAYGQLILNALVGGRLALGAVPTFLHNPRIADATAKNAFVLGMNGTLYLSSMAAVFGEWLASGARPDYNDPSVTLKDAVTLGLQLETGGHFFKLMVTNSTRLDPAQVLPGTPYSFTPHEWRFGFNITRVLKIGG
jgi:hypothetical protein